MKSAGRLLLLLLLFGRRRALGVVAGLHLNRRHRRWASLLASGGGRALLGATCVHFS